MADYVALVLEILHVVFGVAWIGALFYSVAVLRAALPRVGMPARKEAVRQIMPVTIRVVPLTAMLTITFGALLFLQLGSFNPDLLIGSRWGQTILVALALTLATFTFGMIAVVRTSHRILVHLNEEACGHAEQVVAMQKRVNSGQIVALVLGLAIIGLMVAASQRV